jgi:uncharacterized membrane protein YGL010W
MGGAFMKSIAEQLSFYAAYHRNKWNVATHFVGIPAIIIGLLVPMGWARIEVSGLPVSGALVFVVAVAVYYLLLDVRLALAISVFIVPAFYAADTISRMTWLHSVLWFLVLFVGGWIFSVNRAQRIRKKKTCLCGQPHPAADRAAVPGGGSDFLPRTAETLAGSHQSVSFAFP